MGSEIVNRQVNVFIESGNAQSSLDALIAKEKMLRTALETASDPEVVKKLNQELTKLIEPIDRATKKISGELSPSIKDLQVTAAKLNAELSKMSKQDAGYAQKSQQLKEVNAQYKAQTDNLKNLNKEHTTLFGKIGEGIKEYGGEALALGGIAAGFELIKSTMEAAIEKEENLARLKSTLDNLGRSDAFDRLVSSAKKLTQQFTYLQEDDITPVFEKLITYGKLTEQQIKDLTPIIINFAAKQRVSLSEATDTITKALEGNGKALRTYGINLKDAGTEADRLNIIMTTLKDKVEGAAAAFGETTAGHIKETQKDFKELQEDLGTELLPVLNGVLRGIQFIILGIGGLGSAIKKVALGVRDAYNFLFNQQQAIANQMAADQEELQDNVLSSVDNFMIAFQEKIKKFSGPTAAAQTAKLIDDTIAEKRKELDKAYQLLADARANGDVEDKKYFTERTKTLSAEMDALRSFNETLGINDTEGDKKFYDKKLKELADYSKAFRDILNQITEYGQKSLGLNLAPIDKDLQEAFNKYSQLFGKIRDLRADDEKDIVKTQTDEEKGLKEAFEKKEITEEQYHRQLSTVRSQAVSQRKIVEEKSNQDLQALDIAYEENRQAIIKKYADEAIKKQKERDDKYFAEQLAFDNKILKQLENLAARQLKRRLTEDQNAGNANTLKGQIKILDDQRLIDEEKAKIEITDAEELNATLYDIEEKYQKDVQELKLSYTVKQIVDYGNLAIKGATDLNNFLNQQDQKELDAAQAKADAKKKILENELNTKILSQSEYNRQSAKIDKELSDQQRKIKRDEFYRQKAIDIARATIDGLAATVAALKGGIPLAIATGAFAALEIGLIAAEKPPAFAKGGVPKGSSHGRRYGASGIALIDRNSRREVGEMEGGEPILSRETYRNNRPLVDRLLHASMHQNGAKISPQWHSSPTPIRYGFIQDSYNRVRMFDKGGIVNTTGAGIGQPSQVVVQGGFSDDQFNILINELAKPNRSYVVLKDINDSNIRLTNIQKDATFR